MVINRAQKTRRVWLAIIIVMILVLMFFWSPLEHFRDPHKITVLLQNLKNNPLAPLIFILFYILAVVLVLPAYILTFLAGPLFGIWWGSLWVTIGANLGCQITFLISRFIGRDYIQRHFVKSGYWSERISRQLETNGFFILLFLRLIPIIPFCMINYLTGLTLIKYRDYNIATFLGMLPGTFLYVYLAATASNINKNPLGIVVPLVLIILLAILTAIINQKYKKRYNDH
jgi:uncharacterized membrane protein YdjX (TVP38/TMEM64 family)